MSNPQVAVGDAFRFLGREILRINRANGWNVATRDLWDDPNSYNIPARLALIHSEVSEALEAYRHGDRQNFEEELADVLIRILDLTEGMGIEIGQAVFAKLDKNRNRGFRHGGKKI